MNNKSIILNFILFFLSITLPAQITITDSLRWHPMNFYTIKNGNKIEKFYYLSFDGAIYQDAFMLPHYIRKLNPPPSTKAIVKIKNIRFEKLSESKNFIGKNKLQAEIKTSAEKYLYRKKPEIIIDFVPAKKINGQIYLVKSFDIEITYVPEKKEKSGIKYKSNSVLTSGKWIKIGIPKTGIYKISFDKLRELGFNNPGSVRVFGNDFGQLPYYNDQFAPDDLIENYVYYGSDYILFFATGANVWYYDSTKEMFVCKRHDYSDTAYYFLTDYNTGFNNSLPTASEPQTPNQNTDTYTWYSYRGEDNYNFLKSGRIWFERVYYNGTKRTYDFPASNIVNHPAKALVSFMGRNYSTNYLTISYSDQSQTFSIPAISGIHGTDYGKIINPIFAFTPASSDNIKITLQYSGSRGALDYIIINARRKIYYDSAFIIQDPVTVGSGNITKFTVYNASSNLMVWDITNPTRPKKIPFIYSNGQGYFIAATDSLRQFIIFDPSQVLIPVFEGKFLGQIANQNLHAIPASTQMVIITYPYFIKAAEQIADIHQQMDNINVKVVTTQQIYNEYSSGMRDAVAIRNFLRSLYIKPNSQLKWVLLFGDGSFKNKYDINNTNFIPTYQTYNSLNTYGLLTITSDDFFGLLDDNEGETNGILDIFIGRIPVKTTEEASIAAEKIKIYKTASEKSFWKNNITFIADDGNDNLFMSQMEQVSNNITTNYPQYLIKKVYIDAYPAQVSFAGEEYPEAVTDIKNAVEKGTLILAYNGHGSETVLTSERVVTISDVRNWTNLNKLTFMITTTCLFGHFDNYDYLNKKILNSGIEDGMSNPQGGLIASFTTPRESYTTTNYYMLNYFFSNVFKKINNKNISLGQAVAETKAQYPSYYNKEFILIGDPALSLSFPTHSISDINITPDTIKALEKVTVSGTITDSTGSQIDFNGRIFVKIFDKPHFYKTLNNDGFGEFTYKDYRNIIFSGEINVINGQFKFDFLTPLDIDKNLGTGKMVYYATDGNKEFAGYKNVIIGGSKDTVINDTQGPEIKIFLNDTTVAGNTITDRNPKVIIYLKDPSGINATSFGMGHEIQLILDEEQFFSLNKYFSYLPNSNTSGKIEYSLYKLKPGKHTITIKAFDVLNNYSEKTIEFTVTDQTNFIINRIFNYPNPFTTNTAFYFEHNQPGKEMTVVLQIFSISGRIVKTISQKMTSSGYISQPIHWDGKDDFGNNIGKGVYVYILTVQLNNGEKVKKIGNILKI